MKVVYMPRCSLETKRLALQLMGEKEPVMLILRRAGT